MIAIAACLGLLAGLGATIQSPPAQPSASPTPSPATFFTTATVVARPTDASSQSAAVILAGDLRVEAPLSAADLLRSRGGLYLSSTGGRGGGTLPYGRGGDPNFFVILVDGTPLNDPTDTQGGEVGLEALSLDEVERVEIVRGPVSLAYGSAGLAGAIQLFTILPEADTGGLWRAKVVAGDARTRDVNLGAGSSWSKGRGFVGGGYANESGRIAADRFQQWRLQGRVEHQARPSLNVQAAFRWADAESDDYPEGSGGPGYGAGIRQTESRELSGSTRLLLSRGTGFAHLLEVSVLDKTRLRASPPIGFSVPRAREDASFGRFRAHYQARRPAGESGFLVSGAIAEREQGTNLSTLFLPPFLGGDLSGDYRSRRWIGALYLDGRFVRRSVSLDLGGRVDLPSSKPAQWSPRLGLNYTASPAVRLRASFGRGFKLPSFFALSSPAGLGGNPDLRSETSRAFEAGIEARTDDGRLMLSIVGFESRYENLIDFSFDEFRNVNRGLVRARGVESAVSLRLGRRLTLEGEVVRQDADGPTDAEPLRHRPNWYGSVRARVAAARTLTVVLSAVGASRSFDQQVPAPDRTSVAGSVAVGSAMLWNPLPHLDLGVRIDNLLDRDYESLIGFKAPGRAVRVSLGFRRP